MPSRGADDVAAERLQVVQPKLPHHGVEPPGPDVVARREGVEVALHLYGFTDVGLHDGEQQRGVHAATLAELLSLRRQREFRVRKLRG